jgi:hypothetical protein
MKHSFWIGLGSAWVLAVGAAHAEPAHAPTVRKAVDLDAAAKATAALYATMPSPSAPAPVPASVQPALKPLLPPVQRPSVLLPATPAESAVAAVPAPVGEVWQGPYQCEHAEKVQLRPDTVSEQVELQWKNQRWKMRRIDSHSGAMRLEDPSGRMVWIQLGNKSMLLDQRLGKRLLDECQHAVQVQTAAQMKANPPPALFDTSGMGR